MLDDIGSVLIVFGECFKHLEILNNHGFERDVENEFWAICVHDVYRPSLRIESDLKGCEGLQYKIVSVPEYNKIVASNPVQPKTNKKNKSKKNEEAVVAQSAEVLDFNEVNPQRKLFADQNKDVVNFLKIYSGSFDFLLSLKEQYLKNGKLSPKQLDAARKIMQRQADTKQDLAKNVYSVYTVGSLFYVSKNIAKQMSQKFGMSFNYRRIEVIECVRETEKAVLLTFRYTPKFSKICNVCGLHLDNERSVATGIGPICAEKLGLDQYDKKLAKEIISDVESKLQLIGQKQEWFPKRSLRSEMEGADQEE